MVYHKTNNKIQFNKTNESFKFFNTAVFDFLSDEPHLNTDMFLNGG